MFCVEIHDSGKDGCFEMSPVVLGVFGDCDEVTSEVDCFDAVNVFE